MRLDASMHTYTYVVAFVTSGFGFPNFQPSLLLHMLVYDRRVVWVLCSARYL